MWRSALSLVLLTALAARADGPQPPKGGIEFQGASVRAMQADTFSNPGLLWSARGEQVWAERCTGCHGAVESSMKGAAVHYPRYDEKLGRVVDLEQRINACTQRT